MEVGPFLENLKAVASSPYALIGYVVVVAAWVYVAKANGRLKIITEALNQLPPKDRLQLLESEYKTVPRKGLSAEQWIRSRKHLYYFLGFGVIVIAALILLLAALTRPTSTTDERHPRLNAVLVVDLVDPKRVLYHFELENTGGALAEGIRFQATRRRAMLHQQMERADENQLLPKGRLAFRPKDRSCDPSKPLAIELITEFHGRVGSEVLRFSSLHNFDVPSQLIRVGRFEPVRFQQGANQIKPVDRALILSVLRQNQGNIGFRISETNILATGAEPTLVNIGGLTPRSFVFDAKGKFVGFNSIDESGKPLVLSANFNHSPDGWHVVEMSWTTNAAQLVVDGALIEAMR